MNQRELQTLEYLREENRVLREQPGERRARFDDDQRRRLAAKAKGLGRRRLAEVATLKSGRWQLLLVFGILSVVCQLLFWSRSVCPSHPSTRREQVPD